MNQQEKIIHSQICRYLDAQYPKVMYMSDASGLKMSIGQAVQQKKIRCKKYKILDITIFQTIPMVYSGLVIEVKEDASKVFGAKGQVLKNEHVEKQIESLKYLTQQGYYASFGLGFDHCKAIIDSYIPIATWLTGPLLHGDPPSFLLL